LKKLEQSLEIQKSIAEEAGENSEFVEYELEQEKNSRRLETLALKKSVNTLTKAV
jgi:hypothetical protein